ncbi:unnamed protein product [Pipistrellus nathusii]|uniref:Uncharacterized protein n=1 Tax=Pipistrellus nathusii TaxID=59473 RepID=A0ABP0A939_PIPNA
MSQLHGPKRGIKEIRLSGKAEPMNARRSKSSSPKYPPLMSILLFKESIPSSYTGINFWNFYISTPCPKFDFCNPVLVLQPFVDRLHISLGLLSSTFNVAT